MTSDYDPRVVQWSKRLVELAGCEDSEAAVVALGLVSDPELVRSLESARRLGGPEAVRELLGGVEPGRLVRAARELAKAVEGPEVSALLKEGKGGTLAGAAGAYIDPAKAVEALGRLAALGAGGTPSVVERPIPHVHGDTESSKQSVEPLPRDPTRRPE